MNRAGKIAVGVLALAAVIGLAWWLLGREEDEIVRGAQVINVHATPAADAELPGANATGAAADVLAPKSLATQEAAPAAAATPGTPITFTGRVLDESGHPVKDAEVVHIPSDVMREAAGLDDATQKQVVPWSQFQRARTDGQGRFTLPSRELPVHRSPLLDFSTDNSQSYYRLAGGLPRLAVLHPAFQPTLFPAFAFARGESEVGDLVVSACGAVVGRCVDKDGLPVADVPIRLSEGDQPTMDYETWRLLHEQSQTTSGSDGRFFLGGLWNLELTVEFAAEGFEVWRQKVALTAAARIDLGDLRLDRGGVVSGWVMSAAGAPLAGARVALRPIVGRTQDGPDAAVVQDSMHMRWGGSGYELRTTTAADGSFRLAGASKDDMGWRAIAGADGYDAAMVDNVKPDGEPLRFALQPGATLLLRVVEPGGTTSVAGARVEAHRRAASPWGDEPWPVLLAATRDGEVWRILGAGAGSNDALVSAPGHATQGFLLPGVPSGDSRDQTIELPQQAVLAGRVVDEQGAPVPQANIRVRPPTDVPVKLQERTGRGDEQGAFRLDALCAGDWTLTPAAEGFVPAEPVVQTVKAGEHVEALVLKLARGGSIAGRLLGRDPHVVAGREVHATPGDAVPPAVSHAVASMVAGALGNKPAPKAAKSITFKGVVDDRGEYAIRGLPAGNYHVTCSPGAQADVAVAAGAETRLDLALHEPPRIHGRVTMAGAPVEGAEVVLGDLAVNYWDEVKTTTTDASGQYALTLDAEGEGYGREVFARLKDWKTRSVKAAPHFDEDLTADLAFAGGAMVGEVVDEQAQPMHVQVQWVALQRDGFLEGDKIEATADTDASGHFRLEHLPDGHGPLMIGMSGYVGVTLDEEIKDGGTTTVPRIVLRKGCDLEVHVGGVGVPQNSMNQFLIRIRSVADASWKGTERHMDFGKTTTFHGIPAGAIEITVLKPTGGANFEPLRTVSATVQLGQVTHFEQPVDG